MHHPTHAPLSIPVHRVGSAQAFHFDIQPFINTPVEHPIELVSPLLSWLQVSTAGIVSGIAPETKKLLQFWITLDIGYKPNIIRTGFLLQIVPLLTPTTTVPRNPIPMLHPVNPDLPHTYDLLDYIFYYLDTYDHENFLKLLKEQSEKLGKSLSEPVQAHEFKELITTINPLAEQQLREKAQALQMLTLAELTADEMINLFRQGSQPLGMIAIVVFNYLAAPDRFNFSHVKNVLDFAADEMIELIERNQLEFNLREAIAHNPIPTKKI